MGAVQRLGVPVEEQAPAADHHATASGSRTAGREDLHRQGADRRERDPEVSATRHPGRVAASAASYPHQAVSGQRRHDRVVSHVYVGRYIFEKRRAAYMVRYGRQAVRDPEGIDNSRPKVRYVSRLKYCFIGSAQKDESSNSLLYHIVSFLNIN